MRDRHYFEYLVRELLRVTADSNLISSMCLYALYDNAAKCKKSNRIKKQPERNAFHLAGREVAVLRLHQPY